MVNYGPVYRGNCYFIIVQLLYIFLIAATYMRYDVLVIGAGAAGLIATGTGQKLVAGVCLLGASDNAGGRISTINDGFPEPAAAGPGFIHGNLNLTLQIVQEAGLTLEPVSGNMIPVKKANGWWMKHTMHIGMSL